MQLAAYMPVKQEFAPAVVGEPCTAIGWTDRTVYTVVSVSKSGKTAKVQTRRRLTNPTMAGGGYYTTEPDPNGAIFTVRLTKKGWRAYGTKYLMGVADAYYDFGF
jgi:hypothetical protein